MVQLDPYEWNSAAEESIPEFAQ